MALTSRYVTDAGAGAADGTSLGNAMSYATFTDYMVTGGSFTAAPGDVFLLCGISQARTTTTDAWVNGGNATSPVVVRGCDASGNSGYGGRTNGNGALITTNFPVITYTTGRLNLTGTFLIIENLNISTANSAGSITASADTLIARCKIANSSTNAAAAGVTLGSRGILLECDVDLTGASGGTQAVQATSVNTVVDSCRIKVVSTCPAVICASSSTVCFNTIFGSGGIGISMNSTSGVPYIRNNTIQGCTGDGIDIITGTTGLQRIFGNMSTDNTGAGIDMVSTANAAVIAYNRTRDNSSGIANGGDWVTATSYGEVTTDTGGPETDYVNAGSNDYSLIAASPATSAGLPAYASIGALQRSQTSSGGMGVMNRGMTGGINN